MKEKIIITHKNRDGAKIWLEHLYDNTYKLNTDKSFVLEYMRVIFDNIPDDSLIYDFDLNGKKAKCNAIDPSGGPFISVGEIFENYKVIRIYDKENIGIIFDVEVIP